MNTFNEVFKWFISKLSSPHELSQVSRNKRTMLTHLLLLLSLDTHPHILYILCMCMCIRINEVRRMVHSVVLITFWTRWDVVICSPLIRKNSGPWQDELLDDWQQGRGITFFHSDCETFASVTIDATKHPLSSNWTSVKKRERYIWQVLASVKLPSIIFSFPPSTLVYLNYMADTTNHCWILKTILHTNISHKVLPVNDGGIAFDSTMTTYNNMWIKTLGPIKHEIHQLSQC